MFDSVEKTKQCHAGSSVFPFLDLMRKKNIQLKVPFRNGRGSAPVWGCFLPVSHFEGGTRVKFHHWLISHQGLSMNATETIWHACQYRQTHTPMHSQTYTNANWRKMLMPVIISEPPLSSMQQHSFRGHRCKKESVPSWLLLIGPTDMGLPGYQLTLKTKRRILSILILFSFIFCQLLSTFQSATWRRGYCKP